MCFVFVIFLLVRLLFFELVLLVHLELLLSFIDAVILGFLLDNSPQHLPVFFKRDLTRGYLEYHLVDDALEHLLVNEERLLFQPVCLIRHL